MKLNYNPLRNRLSLTAFLVLVIFISDSCKKDDQTIGLGVQPEGDGLNIFQDSVLFTASLYKADSMRTDEIAEAFLGNYDDDQFGLTKTVFYGQLELPGNDLDLGSPENLLLDSVILTVRTTQRIIGSLEMQSFSVFELNEDLYNDSLYYSNRQAETLMDDLVIPGEDVIAITNATNITRGDSVHTVISIPLVQEIGQRLLNESGSVVFEDNESFQSFFKGLAINSNTADGGVFGIDPNDGLTSLNIYYRNATEAEEDTLSVSFQFDNNSAYYNYFDRDYTTSVFGDFEGSLESNDKIYLQGIDGLMARLSVDDFPVDIIGDSSLVISSAKLVMPLANDVNSKYSIPSVLYLSAGNVRDSLKIIEDQIFGLSLDGFYDIVEGAYVFDLPLHFQNIILESSDLESLWISVNPPERLREFLDGASYWNRFFIEPKRVILNGPNSNSQNATENMRLILTYSE